MFRMLFTAAIVVMLSGAGPLQAKTLQIVATFSILGDIVSEIGGPDIKVRSLIGPDGEVHAFEPSPEDARALAGADLVIVNRLGLEGWIDRLVAVSGYKGPIVVASEGVKTRSSAGEAGAHTHKGEQQGVQQHDADVDPHAWNSPANGAVYAANIARALAAADPAHATQYRERAERYAAELDRLDAWARDAIAAIPPAKRKIITSHEALGYLADAYGIEVHAPIGLSTAAEPSAADMAALIKQMRHEHIKAVFLENTGSPRLVQQIARETGAKPGGTLYPEALSPPGGLAPSYLELLHHNIDTILLGMQQN